MGQHKRPTTIEAQNSAVFNHLRSSGHSFDLGDVKILDKEENWSRRGIKEAVWERIESPSLNKKGGLRFVLSHTWDRALLDVPGQLSRDTYVSQADSTESWRRPCDMAETSIIHIYQYQLEIYYFLLKTWVCLCRFAAFIIIAICVVIIRMISWPNFWL